MRSASTTEVRKTLRPGTVGTRRLQRDWGDRLVCVRHRVDPGRGVRFTTVEIVVSSERATDERRSIPADALVYARVGPTETALRKRLLEANAATYDRELNAWRMQYATAVRLGLARRMLRRRPAPSRLLKRPGNSNIPAHPRLAITAHKSQNRSETE